MSGPIYEGDGGAFLAASRQGGQNVVPGTNRPLGVSDVQKAAAQKRVTDNSIFRVRGESPGRAVGGRRGGSGQGNMEVVLGYKFTNEAIVVYRGAAWEKLSTTVDVPALIADMSKQGKFSDDERDVLVKWSSEAERRKKPLDLPYILRVSGMLGQTSVGLTRAQQKQETKIAVVKAILRRTSIQVLMKQNVDTAQFLSGLELVEGQVDNLLDDLQDYNLDDLF